VLHGYDSLSFNLDVRWDVLGAHNGMVAAPSVTYMTPLSRGAAVVLTLDAEYGNDRFMDYYYSVTPSQALSSGLSEFQADSGFTKAGAMLMGGLDINGDLTDGGFAVVLMGSYARMLGDAKASPFTSERGNANQWMGALGLGYVF
jgi:outer membrane protein